MKIKRGNIILLGGTKNREKNIDIFIDVISLLNPIKILIIPSAAPKSIAFKLAIEYKKIFKAINSKINIDIIEFNTIEELNDKNISNVLKSIDLVFFTGGCQFKLNKILINTLFTNILMKRFKNGLLDIVGTSAGASVFGGLIMFSEDELNQNSKISFEKGLALLKNVIIDSHFLSRKRLSRLTSAINDNPSYVGFGLSEDSGLIMNYHEKKVKIIGKEYLFLLTKDKRTSNFPIQKGIVSEIKLTVLKKNINYIFDSLGVNSNQ